MEVHHSCQLSQNGRDSPRFFWALSQWCPGDVQLLNYVLFSGRVMLIRGRGRKISHANCAPNCPEIHCMSITKTAEFPPNWYLTEGRAWSGDMARTRQLGHRDVILRISKGFADCNNEFRCIVLPERTVLNVGYVP